MCPPLRTSVCFWYLTHHSVKNVLCLDFIIILQALETGALSPGGVVTEGSAGSTAISLATVAPAYGCRCYVVIPDDAAIEKV